MGGKKTHTHILRTLYLPQCVCAHATFVVSMLLIQIYEVFATKVAALLEIYEMPTRSHYLSSINHKIHFYHATTCHKPDHMLLLPPSQTRAIRSGHLFQHNPRSDVWKPSSLLSHQHYCFIIIVGGRKKTVLV